MRNVVRILAKPRIIALVIILLAVSTAWYFQATKTEKAVAEDPFSTIVSGDDHGDHRAQSSLDRKTVRRHIAVGIHLLPGADRAAIFKTMQQTAKTWKLGEVTESSFALFSPEMLEYMVPDMAVALSETATPQDADVLMSYATYPGVGYYIIQRVLVHEVTFGITDINPVQLKAKIDAEGILADSLGKYDLLTQDGGLTVKYFGAILSDQEVDVVKEALSKYTNLSSEQVIVTPSVITGDGVDLSTEPHDALPDAPMNGASTQHIHTEKNLGK